MKIHRMTKYEAGQDLIFCADTLSEKEADLRAGGFTEHADILRRCRLRIGRAFNELNSHLFGLPEELDVPTNLRCPMHKVPGCACG